MNQTVALSVMSSLSTLKQFTDTLPTQAKRMPVLFTSHGNPLDIPLSKEEKPFWNSLHELGKGLQHQYEIKAALIVSAHWCTNGTYVNISPKQTQLYDYYGFPKEYYTVKYQANGAPDIAREVKKLVPSAVETTDWGLDHGAWPMLMHLFPGADIPVFQMSIYYDAKPDYHYELGRQLKALREKGVLIIGSGSIIHNIPLASQKFRSGDMTPFGWEADYDAWIKTQIEARNISTIINYATSHKLGKMAAPTPDHFVPILYSLGLMGPNDEVDYFYDSAVSFPAFSERSFMISEKA